MRLGSTITLFGVGAALAVAALVADRRGSGSGPAAGRPVVRAERRDLEVTLVEPGTLKAARSVTLASEIRSNRAKIVSLLADGSWVKPGEAVVSFDPTPFEEERARALAEVRDAEALATRTDQERKLQVAKTEEALETGRHSQRIAQLNLESYEKGTGALTVREAEVHAAEVGSELEHARRDLRDMEGMLERGFVSQGEVSRQRLKVEELGRRRGLSEDRLAAARDVTYPRDLERARTQVQEAKDGVARAEAVLYYTHEFYRAAVESAARKVESAREALRVAEEQLSRTNVWSPIEGFLILQDIPLDAGRRKPQVGDSVWSGVPIATVPDLSQVLATTRVREVDLHLVRQGLPASVAVEAYPDLVLGGRIAFIGSLAEAVSESPWKFFTVSLELERSDPRFRPGMSVRVSFRIDAAQDAIVLPSDAIFPRGDRSVCYVRRGGQVWEQEVSLGKRNETHVEVRSGVVPGEECLLAEPDEPVRQARLPESGA